MIEAIIEGLLEGALTVRTIPVWIGLIVALAVLILWAVLS